MGLVTGIQLSGDKYKYAYGANFVQIKSCGNAVCHKLTQINHAMNEDCYEFWMLYIRYKLLETVETLKTRCDRITRAEGGSEKNAKVIKYWENALRNFNRVGDAPEDSPLREFAESPRFGGTNSKRPARLQQNKQSSPKAKSCIKAFYKDVPGRWADGSKWFHSQRSSRLPDDEVPSCDGSCGSCSSSPRSSRSSSGSLSPPSSPSGSKVLSLIDSLLLKIQIS